MSEATNKYCKKYNFLRVRVDDETKKDIETAASFLGMSVSSFLLECYYKYADELINNDDFEKI